ncbi:MAG: hypothetical protein JXR37_15625 [Kiritimatiellae bacterium]|nr:hypothetical protein [Kiritimatiellia bacterium]
MNRLHRLVVCGLGALMIVATPATAAVPEGFAVLGDRIKDYPPLAGFVAAPVEKRVPPKPSVEDEAHGYMLYARSPSDTVERHSVPALDELTDARDAFATPGEYEPWTFSIYALRELKDVRVTVSPLLGEGGRPIPPDHVDLRVLGCVWRLSYGTRYRWMPGFLEHRDAVDVEAETSRRFWITVKVPEDAAPGVYEGAVRITTAQGARGLKLRLRVLPFALDRAPYRGSMLAPSLQMYGDVFGAERLHEKLVDLREHGCGDAVGYFTFAPHVAKGANGEPVLDFDKPHDQRVYYSCNQIVAALRRAGMDGPIYVNQGGARVKVFAGQWGKAGTPAFEQAFVAIVRKWHDYARQNDWPPLVLGYGDEPSHSTEKLQECRYMFRLLSEGGANGTSYINGPWGGIDSPSMFWPHMKIVHANYYDPPMLERMRLRRQRLWLYNVGIGRFEYGWQCIASGTELVSKYDYQTWAYSGKRGPFTHCAAGADAVTRKPIPSPEFENAREGIDDGRYYATLLNHIGRALLTRNDSCIKAAQAAEQTLEAWLKQVPLDRGFFREGGELDFSGADLHKMRWRMAAHILELNALLEPYAKEPWYR